MECPRCRAVNPDSGQLCGRCGSKLRGGSTPRLERKHYLAIVLVAILALLIVGYLKGGPSSGGGSGTNISTAEYQQALQECEGGPGAQWVAEHPGLDPHSPVVSAEYAAVVNRCLVDKFNLNPSYLPGKPIAP